MYWILALCWWDKVRALPKLVLNGIWPCHAHFRLRIRSASFQVIVGSPLWAKPWVESLMDYHIRAQGNELLFCKRHFQIIFFWFFIVLQLRLILKSNWWVSFYYMEYINYVVGMAMHLLFDFDLYNWFDIISTMRYYDTLDECVCILFQISVSWNI